MHYYQFNIGEYASHTRHLSPLEDLAYRRLLDLSYTTELPLIKDIRQLTRLLNLRDYQQEVEDVLKEFFFETDEGWLNNRVIKEIEKTGRKSEAAKNSAAIRWDNERKAKKMQEQCEEYANASVNNANAYENDATNNQIPITNNQIPNTKYQIKNISPLSSLMALGISKKSANDWLRIRKAKKLVFTDDALELFKSECLKAGITASEAVKICNQESWGGFKAEWLNKQGKAAQFQTKSERISANNEKAANEFLNNSNEKIIEGEVIHA
jgi:uncharacterized protein YdaU (DUF1376 family)